MTRTLEQVTLLINYLLLGVNFTNILRTSFTHADPKSGKMTVKSSVLFTLLGSARIKALRKMFVKLSPGMQILIGGHELLQLLR